VKNKKLIGKKKKNEEQLICSECKEALESDSKFCSNCGAKINVNLKEQDNATEDTSETSEKENENKKNKLNKLAEEAFDTPAKEKLAIKTKDDNWKHQKLDFEDISQRKRSPDREGSPGETEPHGIIFKEDVVASDSTITDSSRHIRNRTVQGESRSGITFEGDASLVDSKIIDKSKHISKDKRQYHQHFHDNRKIVNRSKTYQYQHMLHEGLFRSWVVTKRNKKTSKRELFIAKLIPVPVDKMGDFENCLRSITTPVKELIDYVCFETLDQISAPENFSCRSCIVLLREYANMTSFRDIVEDKKRLESSNVALLARNIARLLDFRRDPHGGLKPENIFLNHYNNFFVLTDYRLNEIKRLTAKFNSDFGKRWYQEEQSDVFTQKKDAKRSQYDVKSLGYIILYGLLGNEEFYKGRLAESIESLPKNVDQQLISVAQKAIRLEIENPAELVAEIENTELVNTQKLKSFKNISLGGKLSSLPKRRGKRKHL